MEKDMQSKTLLGKSVVVALADVMLMSAILAFAEDVILEDNGTCR